MTLLAYVFNFLPPVLYGGSLTLSQLTGWPRWAVLAGIGGGGLIQIERARSLWVSGAKLHWLGVGAIAEVLTKLLIIIISLCTDPPTAERVEPFLWRLIRLRTYDDGTAPRPWWQQVKLAFATYTLVWC